jgi:hypothetical protein
VLNLLLSATSEFPDSVWYADDGSIAGYFAEIRAQFERLQQLPTPWRHQVFELQDLVARALIPSAARDEPLIYPVRSAIVEENEGLSTPTEERGYLLISNIWRQKKKNYSKPAKTNAVTSLPLWFRLMECLERSQEVKDVHCHCTSHTYMHPRITHPHETNEPTSPVGSGAGLRLNDTSQNRTNK